MALTHIPLIEINEGHLRRLIETQATESLRIDYKRDSYGNNDDQRREYLADVSSFANSLGGDIVIGVSASNGVPKELQGFRGDADAEILRLEQMAREGLQPRIARLQLTAIPLTEGATPS